MKESEGREKKRDLLVIYLNLFFFSCWFEERRKSKTAANGMFL